MGGFLLGVIFLPKTGIIEEKGVLGGPALVQSAQGAQVDSAAVLKVEDAPFLTSNTGAENYLSPVAMDSLYTEGAIKDPGESVGPAFDPSGLTTYKVQKGDNLSKIASYFGISAATIVNANPGVKSKSLKAGDTLKILPTSGVIYQTKTGDTLDSISTMFDVPKDKITQFNPSVNFSVALDPGVSIVIPGGTSNALLASAGNSLPNFNSQFIAPANGYNWGILHHYNAVDIANSCGTPVVASAEGLVIPDESISDSLGGWNGGYGNFVLIEHPFGDKVETRYAHLEKTFVQIGDYVKQGDEIGLMGESGEASGCHVHFEVIGARNPFAKS